MQVGHYEFELGKFDAVDFVVAEYKGWIRDIVPDADPSVIYRHREGGDLGPIARGLVVLPEVRVANSGLIEHVERIANCLVVDEQQLARRYSAHDFVDLALALLIESVHFARHYLQLTGYVTKSQYLGDAVLGSIAVRAPRWVELLRGGIEGACWACKTADQIAEFDALLVSRVCSAMLEVNTARRQAGKAVPHDLETLRRVLRLTAQDWLREAEFWNELFAQTHVPGAVH